ncbi:MAG: hypothetical protein MI750_02480, partial [Xanthomonadales bacterium]|nr:hypothetical protein [Xanthomonadales bacterium]
DLNAGTDLIALYFAHNGRAPSQFHSGFYTVRIQSAKEGKVNLIYRDATDREVFREEVRLKLEVKPEQQERESSDVQDAELLFAATLNDEGELILNPRPPGPPGSIHGSCWLSGGARGHGSCWLFGPE